MHLIYTQNYWEEFCPEILQQKLHHQPSKGGESENEKHKSWFTETLENYEKIFEQEPPKDIWNPVQIPSKKRKILPFVKIFLLLSSAFVIYSCTEKSSDGFNIFLSLIFFFIIIVVIIKHSAKVTGRIKTIKITEATEDFFTPAEATVLTVTEVPVAAVPAEAVVAADAVAAEVEEINQNTKYMKKILIHIVPVLISLIWLIAINHTLDPISLKGHYFLKFYFILVLGFYASVFALKFFEETISRTTFYFLISIFLLGVVKLVKGIFLGKPIGYLMMILILEIIVSVFVNLFYLNHKMK